MNYLKYGWYIISGVVIIGATIYMSNREYVKVHDIIELVLGFEERYYATYRSNDTRFITQVVYITNVLSTNISTNIYFYYITNITTNNGVTNYSYWGGWGTNITTNLVTNYIFYTNFFTNLIDNYVRKSLLTNIDYRTRYYLSGRYFVPDFVTNPLLCPIESNLPLVYLTNVFLLDKFITNVSTSYYLLMTNYYLVITQQNQIITNLIFSYITNVFIETNIINVGYGTNYKTKDYLFFIYSNLYLLQYATIPGLSISTGLYHNVNFDILYKCYYESPEYSGAFTSVINMIITGFPFRNLYFWSEDVALVNNIHNDAYERGRSNLNYFFSTNGVQSRSNYWDSLFSLFSYFYSYQKQGFSNISYFSGNPIYISFTDPNWSLTSPSNNSILDIEVYDAPFPYGPGEGWRYWGSVIFSYQYPVHAFVSLFVNNIWNPTYAVNYNGWVGQLCRHQGTFNSYEYYQNPPNFFSNEKFITRLFYNNAESNNYLKFSIWGLSILPQGVNYTNFLNPYFDYNFGGLGAYVGAPPLFFTAPYPPYTNESASFIIRSEYLNLFPFEYCTNPIGTNSP